LGLKVHNIRRMKTTIKKVSNSKETIIYTFIGNSCDLDNISSLLDNWRLCLTAMKNFKVTKAFIATVGEIKGLEEITKIPTGRVWSIELGAVVNYGYVMTLQEGGYVKLFVSNWKEKKTWFGHKKTYCTIKYQYPFNPQE